jgi:hypothetical protein
MKKGITFVGMDAHKVAIKLAVLLPGETKPVEWQLANEKAAVRRMVRKVQRMAPGDVRFWLRGGSVRLRAAAMDPGGRGRLHGDRTVSDPAQAGRSHQDRSS